jgi:hypothetical protein
MTSEREAFNNVLNDLRARLKAGAEGPGVELTAAECDLVLISLNDFTRDIPEISRKRLSRDTSPDVSP